MCWDKRVGIKAIWTTLGMLINVFPIYKTVWGWLGMGSKKALHTPLCSDLSHRGKEPK